MTGWYDIGSIPEYCKKVSKRTAETWIREEGLRFVKIRGKRFVKKDWLDNFLEAHEATNNGKKVDQIVTETVRDMNL
jgi:excisionase family DNA binding protein